MRRQAIILAVFVLGALGVCPLTASEQVANEAQHGWWAFQPLSDPSPPNVANDGRAPTEIDRFVLAKLELHGLSPAPPADRRVWLRRAKFALVGLPPTPGEMDAFLRDDQPDAYERVIDLWLSSPHFGEHWGRHWLDVVRYTDYLSPRADEAPEEGDVELFEAFRYRDWVVSAFNRDMPFNDFIIHQIAGDQLSAGGEGDVYAEGLIATTLLSIGVWDNGDADKEKIVSDIVDDQINVVGQAFLGLTLACARCHDHKFDPISIEDYYGLAGIFYSTRVLKSLGPVGLHTVAMRVPLVPQEYVQKRESQLARLAELEKLLKPSTEEATKTESTSNGKSEVSSSTPLPEQQRKQLEQEREQLQNDLLPAPSTALAVQDGATPGGLFPEIGDVPVHFAGRYDQLGPKIPRRLPTFFCGTDRAPIANGSGRMELAQWIASQGNPLTPRVIVNRVWQQLFSQGLVRTPNNFGLLGEKPSHPELLDWLARRFIERGWSLKQLIRIIMLSSAYQQASLAGAAADDHHDSYRLDPENRWLARFPSRRLHAEELRDSVLSVAGRLDSQLGGKATINLHQPRRSLYIQTVRSDRRNFSTLFDAADPGQCVGQRNVTTIAPQALFMLNDAFVIENAQHTAAKLAAEIPTDDSARIARAYVILFGRQPTQSEASIGRELLAAAAQRDPSTAWGEYIHVLLCSNEFCQLD
ncbi:MAG: DUF1549 and DUF1553 domain-containing protein [Pirellulales bacterium]